MIRILLVLSVAPGCLDALRPPVEPPQHRDLAAVCDAGRPSWSVEPGTASTYGYADVCTTHEDCTDGDDGRCTVQSSRGGSYLTCTYTECLTDADCGGLGVCACKGDDPQDHNVCLPAGDCQTDADCGDDYCSLSFTDCGPQWGELLGHFCHTRQDECRADADCGGTGAYCAFDEEGGRWACMDSMCVG